MARRERGFKPAAIGTSSSAALSDRRTHRGTANLLALNTIELVLLVEPGDYIEEIWAAGRAVTNGTPATARFVLYETTASGNSESVNGVTTPAEGALIGAGILSVATSVGTVAWYSATGLNVDLSPWAGKYVKLAIISDGGQWRRVNVAGGLSGDMVSGSTGGADDPFGSATGQTSLNPFYMVVQSGAGLSDINGGSPATYGDSVTWTATGFVPSSATVDGVAATSVSETGMTIPSLVDGQATARPGARTVTATDGTNSPSANLTINPPAGYQYFQLTTQTSDPAKATPDEAVSGDHWMVETKDSTVATADGLVSTNHDGEILAWLIKDDTKIAGQYAIIFGEGGEYIETRKISARNIYAEKIKAVKITASKI